LSETGNGETVALETVGLSKSFDQLRVLDDINIKVKSGEFLAVVGPNGAGKTTWCNVVTGFEPAQAGQVKLHGTAIDHMKPHNRYRAGITRTFQTPRILESLTLEENVAVSIRVKRGEAITRARAFLEGLGVEATTTPGHEASLYERRVVELGRAAVNSPDVIVLDEPLAGLRQPEHEAILGLARRVASDGAAVVIIEHLIPTIAPVVDRMVVLANTRVLAEGRPNDVLRLPAVIDAYLGQPMSDGDNL